MAKYVYKNLKGCIINGIEPHGTKEFDHQIEGGGIQLIEVKNNETKNRRKVD